MANRSSLSAVEFGALYGNTTLAYKFNKGWDETTKIWADDAAPLVPRHSIHVMASDISGPALEYGLRRGIFNDICVHDFKPFPPELSAAVADADMLFCLMATNYLKTLQWQRICLQFLGDRTKPKMLVYNVVAAFDKRNLSPEVLFASIKNWRASTHFIKHRNFSDEERPAHHNCRESWTLTYVVRFEADTSALPN